MIVDTADIENCWQLAQVYGHSIPTNAQFFDKFEGKLEIEVPILLGSDNDVLLRGGRNPVASPRDPHVELQLAPVVLTQVCPITPVTWGLEVHPAVAAVTEADTATRICFAEGTILPPDRLVPVVPSGPPLFGGGETMVQTFTSHRYARLHVIGGGDLDVDDLIVDDVPHDVGKRHTGSDVTAFDQKGPETFHAAVEGLHRQALIPTQGEHLDVHVLERVDVRRFKIDRAL